MRPGGEERGEERREGREGEGERGEGRRKERERGEKERGEEGHVRPNKQSKYIFFVHILFIQLRYPYQSNIDIKVQKQDEDNQ